MEYRIVVDSCGELTDEMKKSGIYKTASLSMEVDGVHIQDDESFDQAGKRRFGMDRKRVGMVNEKERFPFERKFLF